MGRKSAGLLTFAILVLIVPALRAEEPELAPWNHDACDGCAKKRSCDKPFVPTMFGDQFQGGFNQFNGQFNQGGFNQFNGQFQGGLNQFNQGGFNQGQLQFGGQFNQGGFNQGQLQFGGQFNQGGFNQFNGQFGAPIAVSRGAAKIAENESPRPQDRVYGAYNYYQDVQSIFDVHREMVGIEKTVLDGRASVGLRLPYFQINEVGANTQTDLGDLSIILKYAVVNNDDAVLSAGMVITPPTGPLPSIILFDARGLQRVHATELSPFLGYYWGRNDFYVHGFSSIQVPTDPRDVTVLFNDVGLGYWLYRGSGGLRAVIPTFEVHVNTPLNHTSHDEPVRFVNSVDLTVGSHFRIGERLSIGAAVGIPVSGPRLFEIEGLANINFRF